jgi:hypothetical protein
LTPFNIRAVSGNDIPLIYSTWLKSYQCDSNVGLSVSKSVFFENYRLIVDQILEKNTTEILIACSNDDPNVIYGYLIAEPSENILHYIFVKEPFRNFKIAKSLFNQAFHDGMGVVIITHSTYSAKELTGKFTFNPFKLWKTGENYVR